MYLLDTNVVSEMRRPKPHGAVVAWLRSVNAEDLYLSSVTIGELQKGIELTRERDPAKAAELEAWVEQLIDSHDTLDMDSRAFRCWAKLMHRKPDHHAQDGMIASIAAVHGLVVATRNLKDFVPFGAPTFNPFAMPK